MDINVALNTVLQLAASNILEEKHCAGSPELQEQRDEQLKAYLTVVGWLRGQGIEVEDE